MSAKIVNIADICRTCLAAESVLYPIFETHVDNRRDGTITLEHAIAAVTGIKFDKTEGYPDKVCQNCKDAADKAFRFKKKSCDADVYISDLLNKEKPEVKTEKKDDVKVELNDSGDNINYRVVESGNDNIKTEEFTSVNIEPIESYTVRVTSVNLQPPPDMATLAVKPDMCQSFCPLCQVTYNDIDSLTKHMWKMHAEIMGPKKRGRPRKIITESDPSSSQPSKSEKDSCVFTITKKSESVLWRQCKHCSVVSSTPDELAEHINTRHPNHSLKCKDCDKVFHTLSASRAHRMRCPNIERAYKCSSCPQRFTREVFLNKHILGRHVGQQASVDFLSTPASGKLFQCDTCKQQFLKKSSLSKHMRHHNAEKPFECQICNKRFFRNDNLKSHMRVHGIGKCSTATSLCLYCGRSFTCSSNFIVHMRRHTGEKPYKCDLCDKGFPRSSDLQCHRRSHTGEKPYICQICEKAFSRSNKLTRHMRVHTGSKPYKCTYCEKAFSQSNDLNLHVRRHTGDKPYVCEICGDRFIQGTALQNHRRSQGHYPKESGEVPLPTLAVDTL